MLKNHVKEKVPIPFKDSLSNTDKEIFEGILQLIQTKKEKPKKTLNENIELNPLLENNLENFSENMKNDIKKFQIIQDTQFFVYISDKFDKYFRCKICDSRYSYIKVMHKHLKNSHDINPQR